MKSFRRKKEAIHAVLFAVLCVCPLPLTILGIRPVDFSESTRVAFPSNPDSIRSLISYPGKLKYWFTDAFSVRDLCSDWYGKLTIGLFGSSPNPRVVVGEQGWLYYADEGGLDQYRRFDAMESPEVGNWVHRVGGLQNDLASRGIDFVFLVGPNKNSVYPQWVPATVEKGGQEPGREVIFRALNDAGVLAIDPTEMLRSDSRRLYHKTDTHWNHLGAFLATDLVFHKYASVNEMFWETPVYDVRGFDRMGGDLSRMIGLKGTMVETVNRVFVQDGLSPVSDSGLAIGDPAMDDDFVVSGTLTTVCQNAPFGKAIIYLDSFGNVMVPYLSRGFKRCTFVVGHDVDLDYIQKLEADVVIFEIVERRFTIDASLIVHWK